MRTTPTLFWTGNIALPLRIMVNTAGLIAWITGNARNTSAMKERMRDGYNGEYSDYISLYDELGASYYQQISKQLIEKTKCKGCDVLDVGCGTGILSLIALEKGAGKLTCVDMSEFMLEKCRSKITASEYSYIPTEFHKADAEELPFKDNSFDIVFFNMVLGMIPNQQATIGELVRVLCPGGTIALSAHGPDHYREAIEANLKAMSIHYFLDHRFEFWQRNENEVRSFFTNANLKNIITERITWVDKFENCGQAFDFFATTSALWWYERLPNDLRKKEALRTRKYFQRKKIKSITSDVVLAYGLKK